MKSILTRKPRKVSQIVGTFSSMVEELTKSCAAAMAEAEAFDKQRAEATERRDNAAEEASRGYIIRDRISSLIS